MYLFHVECSYTHTTQCRADSIPYPSYHHAFTPPHPHIITPTPHPSTSSYHHPPLHSLTQALEEPSFSIAYANLCKVLSPMKVEWTTADGKPKTNNFRRVLLTKCQQEFEKDKKDDEERERMLQAIEEADTVCVCAYKQGAPI